MGKILIPGLLEDNRKIIVAIFFLLLLFAGMAAYPEYGMSWDEAANREFGWKSYGQIVERKEMLGESGAHEKGHGPVFELPLVLAEKALGLQDTRGIYLMRHLATFLLFFVGVFFFYKLCSNAFSDWKIGLLGGVFLVLSPRIFAHSFYNSVDIPFLVFFTISMYTLTLYLDKKTFWRASAHAGACALLIGVRVAGIIAPFFTILFFAGKLALQRRKKQEFWGAGKSLLLYLSLLVALAIAFWPFLWNNPINRFFLALEATAKYPWEQTVLYFGEYVKATELPWDYTLVWQLITTPVLYLGLFCAGLLFSMKSLLQKETPACISKRNILLSLLWFFLPIAGAAAAGSTLLDGWRHHFFVYPAFLIISLLGALWLFGFLKAKFGSRAAAIIFILILAIGLAEPACFMVKYHPYQGVYFNTLAGRNMEEVKNNFELDYWGLSYRRGLEHILESDQRETIKVSAANWPGALNALILPPEERARLVYVEDANAEYFLSNYRWHKGEYPYEAYYSVKVGGTKIMGVYRLREQSS